MQLSGFEFQNCALILQQTAVESDWNCKTSQKVKKGFFLNGGWPLFEKNLTLIKIAQDGNFDWCGKRIK